MAKKKRAAKPTVQPAPTKSSARKRLTRARRADNRPQVSPIQDAKAHCYRHEVGANPHHGPLTIEVDISAGRGKHPSPPAFVGFTAEIADEQWPDQFAFRLLSLQSRVARVKITRVDRGLEELSWGDNLIVHVLVLDQ